MKARREEGLWDVKTLFSGCSDTIPDVRNVRTLLDIARAKQQNPSRAAYALLGPGRDPKRVARFFRHPAFGAKELLGPVCSAFLRHACSHHTVMYLLSDSMNLQTPVRSAENVGALHSRFQQGLRLHNAFLVSTNGAALGLADCQIHFREGIGKAAQKNHTPFEQKESARWPRTVLSVVEQARALGWTGKMISVTDAEADIHEFYEACQKADVPFLCRIGQNRCVEEGTRLYDALAKQPFEGTLAVSTWQKKGKQKTKREALLHLRWGTWTTAPNSHVPVKQHRKGFVFSVIEALERHPKKGVTPVKWRLAVGLPCDTFQEAAAHVRAYAFRHRIEEFHFLMKTGGMNVEAARFKNRHHELEKYAALCASLAAQSLVLRDAARHQAGEGCQTWLPTAVWKAAFLLRFQSTDVPAFPPSIQEAVGWIAQLGGYYPRKDRPPGAVVIRRGLQSVLDFLHSASWLLKAVGISLDSEVS